MSYYDQERQNRTRASAALCVVTELAGPSDIPSRHRQVDAQARMNFQPSAMSEVR
jgi:hypothetical protein